MFGIRKLREGVLGRERIGKVATEKSLTYLDGFGVTSFYAVYGHSVTVAFDQSWRRERSFSYSYDIFDGFTFLLSPFP